MKYFLFNNGMALYKKKGEENSRYIDYFPLPKSKNIELILYNDKEAMKELNNLKKILMFDNWKVERYYGV